ncbi:hypothetical protein [Xanthomonas sp. XNM01]|uniref:hypothetical protein n=1 Tax=Xanthomonas sp. XNM01 TaxID=2769289 RepID=UPI00178216BF|nr:hypothetical protein [Xanthomonas sp. XNM01]MBD9368859.1 hypothetical protein [Xanthomonas sp. XNM01]
MSDALDVIEPAPAAVQYRGEQLEVRPLTVGAVPAIVRLARPVIDRVLSLEAVPDAADGSTVDLALDLIDAHGETLFKAVGLAIERDAAWVAGGDIGEFVDLVLVLVQVNRDFFAQRLVPLLQARRTAQATGAGPTPSSSSSSAATH